MEEIMSYDISFRVKVQDTDEYVPIGRCDANTTWNVRDIITKSTGLEWNNCQNNGLCSKVIPKIYNGRKELIKNPGDYRKYEPDNGWESVESTIKFFEQIIKDWESLVNSNKVLAKVSTFWIM